MYIHTHIYTCPHTTLDFTSLSASLHDSKYMKFQELNFPWSEGASNVRKKFLSLGSFTYFLWDVVWSLSTFAA